MLLFKTRKSLRFEQFVRAGEIGREAVLANSNRHFGREVTSEVVSRPNLTIDPELVTLPILHAGDKPAPAAIAIGNTRGVVANFKIVEIAPDVDRVRIRRPNAKRCAVGDEIGSHRRAGANVIERSGNEKPLTDLPDSNNRHYSNLTMPGSKFSRQIFGA